MYLIIYFGLHSRGLMTNGIPEYLHVLCVYGVFSSAPPLLPPTPPPRTVCIPLFTSGSDPVLQCISVLQSCACWSDSGAVCMALV